MSQTEPQPQQAPSRGRWTVGKVPLIVAVVAAVTVVVALLLVWSPWSGDAEPSRADESSATASDAKSSSAESPSDETSATDDSSPSTQPSDDATAGPTDGADSARVPTVVGMPLTQAIAEVKADFGDVRAVAQPNGAGETCTVIAQDPVSGEHPTSTRVTLTYAGTETECEP